MMAVKNAFQTIFRNPGCPHFPELAAGIVSPVSRNILGTKLVPDNHPNTAMADLTECLRQAFHQIIHLEDEEVFGSSFAESIHNLYIKPVIQAANENRPPYLPPLQVAPKPTASNGVIKFSTSYGSNPFPEHPPPVRVRASLPSFIFLNPGTLHVSSLAERGPELHSTLISDLLESVVDWTGGRLHHDVIISDTIHAITFLCDRAGEQGGGDSRVLSYELTPPSKEVPLRLILASLIWRSVVRDWNGEPDVQYFSPHLQLHSVRPYSGAINDPQLPHLTLDKVKDWTSRAAFDLYAVANEARTGDVFAQWTVYSRRNLLTKSPSLPSSALQVLPNALAKTHIPILPLYPLHTLPGETDAFLKHGCRPPCQEMLELLETGQPIELEIASHLETVDIDHTGRSYACRIVPTSTSSQDLSGFRLRIKIFDDRLLNQGLNQVGGRFVHLSSFGGEALVTNEDAAYRRLAHAQGSVLPHYYGAHLVTLPDGVQCWGLLTELTGGTSLKYIDRDLPEKSKAAIISTMRHVVRTFQYADVRHPGWRYSDILLREGSTTCAHPCVVTNLSRAAYSDLAGPLEPYDDYGEVEALLLTLFGEETVKIHFQPREEWDPFTDDSYVGIGWTPLDSDERLAESNASASAHG